MSDLFYSLWQTGAVIVFIMLVVDCVIYGTERGSSPKWISVPGTLLIILTAGSFCAWLLSLIWS